MHAEGLNGPPQLESYTRVQSKVSPSTPKFRTSHCSAGHPSFSPARLVLLQCMLIFADKRILQSLASRSPCAISFCSDVFQSRSCLIWSVYVCVEGMALKLTSTTRVYGKVTLTPQLGCPATSLSAHTLSNPAQQMLSHTTSSSVENSRSPTGGVFEICYHKSNLTFVCSAPGHKAFLTVAAAAVVVSAVSPWGDPSWCPLT